MADVLEKLVVEIRTDQTKLKREFRTLETKLRKDGSKLGKVFSGSTTKSMGLMIGKMGAMLGGMTAMFSAVSAGVRSFRALDKGMRNVNTIVGVSEKKLKGYTKQVQRLQKELGVTSKELTDGLYQAVSAGVAIGDAMNFLEVATKASIGGISDVETAVDGLTTVINAWGLEASEVTRVSDLMFQTVKLGKTTFGELSSSLSTVASFAAASGVSFDEVAAATATLTKQGVPTAMAMTQIRAAMIAMNKHLGDGWADTMTLQEGFVSMGEMAGGSANKLKELTGRVEGANAILATTGEKADGAAKDLMNLKTALGAAGGAFEEQAKSMDKASDRMAESWNVMISKMVGASSGTLTATMDLISNIFGVLEKTPRELLEIWGVVDKVGDEANSKVEKAVSQMSNTVKRGKKMLLEDGSLISVLGEAAVEATQREIVTIQTLQAEIDVLVTKLESVDVTETRTLDIIKRQIKAKEDLIDRTTKYNEILIKGYDKDVSVTARGFATQGVELPGINAVTKVTSAHDLDLLAWKAIPEGLEDASDTFTSDMIRGANEFGSVMQSVLGMAAGSFVNDLNTGISTFLKILNVVSAFTPSGVLGGLFSTSEAAISGGSSVGVSNNLINKVADRVGALTEVVR